MVALGSVTRYVMMLGLLTFIVLAFSPGMRSYAISVTLATPIAAAIVSGFELLFHKKIKEGMAMLGGVALAVAALIFGVSS
jgi:hypothetical protein